MSLHQSPVARGEPLFTRRFWLACGMHFTGAMALSLYILFPLFIRHLGGGQFSIGLYAGMTGAAAVAARLPVGRLLDTQGRRRVLAGAGLLHVVSWIGFLAIDALGVRSALHVLGYGLASGSLFASFFTYANDIVPVERRGEGIAMFAIWGMLPNGLGPLLGEYLIHRGGFHVYFLVAAALAGVSLCVSQLLPETAAPAATASPLLQPRPRTAFPWRRVLFLLMTTLLFGAAVNSVFTFLAPFAQAENRTGVGGFFLTYALTAVAVRVLSGRLPDRIGARRVLIPALFLYAAGVLLLPQAHHPLMLVAAGALCGAGHGYVFPILNVLTVEQAPAVHRGRVVSWFTAMFDLGNTLANPLLGALAEATGYRAMFSTVGVGVLLTAAAVWRRPPPSSAEQQRGQGAEGQIDEQGGEGDGRAAPP